MDLKNMKKATLSDVPAINYRNMPKDIMKPPSWYCDQCHVEVYQLRCVHCGKTKREKT